MSSGSAGRESVGVMGNGAGGLTREEVERRYVTGRDDLFRLAWLVVGDAGVAEDLVQEAYTRLLVRPEQVRDPDTDPMCDADDRELLRAALQSLTTNQRACAGAPRLAGTRRAVLRP